MEKAKKFREYPENSLTMFFIAEIFSQGFPLIFDFSKIIRTLTDKFSRNYFSQVLPEIFSDLGIFRIFFYNLTDVRFQFCSVAESRGQGRCFPPDHQPIRL